MHILILGGTSFVGRAAVQEALHRAHSVTVFNRGNHPTPPGTTQLTGDRLAENGHAALAGHSFDAVLDTWAADPVAVQRAVAALRGRIGHYTYVSSISVYDPRKVTAPLDEDSPVVDPAECDGDGEVSPGLRYACNKRGGELAALEAGVPVQIGRPGLILGPWENQYRLPWWLKRLERAGRTLAPGPRESGLQYTDARDFVAFLIDGAEKSREGVYNCVCPKEHTTFGELIVTANEIVDAGAELVWSRAEDILAAGIQPWTELPIWLPPQDDSSKFFNEGDESKARNAGLKSRPVRDMVQDTWEWLQSEDVKIPSTVGLDPEKEAKFLDGQKNTGE